MKKLLIFLSLLSISLPLSANTIIIDEDFSSGQGDWAVRKQSLATVEFEDSSVKLFPQNQPASVYHTFSDISLLDGEAFRFTVVVSVEDTQGRPRGLRIAMGYSNPPLRDISEFLRIPMKGYWVSFPTLGNETAVRVSYSGFVPPDEDINFFNTSISNLGDIPSASSVGNEPMALSIEVIRSGDELVFTVSMNDVELGDVLIASGDSVLEDFKFNTIGMAFQFTTEGHATYESAKLELLSERDIPLGLDSVFGLLTQVEEGRYATRALGVIHTDLEPWIWHEDLGWMHVTPNDLGNWVLSVDHGWLYINSAWQPWLWSQDQGWLYLQSNGDVVAVQQD